MSLSSFDQKCRQANFLEKYIEQLMGTRAELGIHWAWVFVIFEAFRSAMATANDVRLAKVG